MGLIVLMMVIARGQVSKRAGKQTKKGGRAGKSKAIKKRAPKAAAAHHVVHAGEEHGSAPAHVKRARKSSSKGGKKKTGKSKGVKKGAKRSAKK